MLNLTLTEIRLLFDALDAYVKADGRSDMETPGVLPLKGKLSIMAEVRSTVERAKTMSAVRAEVEQG